MNISAKPAATDVEIHDTVLIAAAFCMFNRYVDGLATLTPADPAVYDDMGRRMALNAPIQGSAADILKLAMIGVDRELAGSAVDCVMVLTVHDELVFDTLATDVEESGRLVKGAMESAFALEVPLRADLGSGPNWAEAVPSGH